MGWLRDAAWLGRERVRAYAIILLLLQGAIVAGWIVLSSPADPLGKPVGTDFVSFWTASRLALSGHPAGAYSMPEHLAAQRALFPSTRDEYYAFFYPPTFLLLCLPLALLPYCLSLGAWLGATGYAWWRVVRAAAGRTGAALPVLAFPAVLINVGHGQNGFLTSALLGGAVLVLDRRPMLSGALLGCLAFKPHLAVLAPVLLLAAGRWRTFVSAAGSAAAFALLSWLAVGTEAWQGFAAAAPAAAEALRSGTIGPFKMQSAYAAVQVLGGTPNAARTLQAASALFAAGSLAWAVRRVRRRTDAALALGSLLHTGTVLTTPFLLDYDLLLLGFPIAWLAREGFAREFLPYERLVLAIAYGLPLVSRSLAFLLGVPVAPLVLLCLHLAVLRRVLLVAEAAPAVPASAGSGPARARAGTVLAAAAAS